MKRFLPLVLIMVLLLCSSCSETETSPSSGADPLSVSIGYWNISGMNDEITRDGIRDRIETSLNIRLVPISVDWTSYKEYYQVLSTLNNLPDVFTTLTISSTDANDNAFYQALIDTGRIQPLPKDLSPYSHLQKAMEQVSYTRASDGRFYAIPHLAFLNQSLSCTDAAMIVRRDWMNHLGLSDPQNLEEFIALVSAFANNDPDGNGINDTVGYNVNSLTALGKWLILGIAPACNTYGWIEENGRYIPSWYSEAFDAVVSALDTLYTCGGLDPDFAVKNPREVLVDFASGHLGALEYKSSPSALQDLKNVWDQYNSLPFEDCVDILPIFPAPDGVTWRNTSLPFWSEAFISSAVSEEKLDKILQLYDFLLSDEGLRLVRYGIEGTDYRINEDGSFLLLDDTGGSSLADVLQKKYPSLSLFSTLASWGNADEDFVLNEMNNARFGSSCMELANKSLTQMLNETVPVERPEAFLIFPKEPSELFSTSTAFESLIHVILSEADPLEQWHQVIAQMQSDGIEAYIQRQNEQYQLSVQSNRYPEE